MLLAAGAGACAQPTPGQATTAAAAKPFPFVSPIFGDNMVLQRGKLDTIWGWSDPGDTVRVQIGESTATGTAGPNRRWQVKNQPPASGGPYTVKITGHQSAELHNVLVADVWLCGGQSNMGLPLRFTNRADEEVQAANYPDIRFFTVGGHPAYHHVDVKLCENAMTAVFLFFRTRRGTSIRLLSYDGQGYWLAQERLSQGRFRWWPESNSPAKALEAYEAQLLMAAGDVLRVRAAPIWRRVNAVA